MILLRMNAREHTLVNYGYSLMKGNGGRPPLLPALRPDDGGAGLVLPGLPFCAAASKLILASINLRDYLRRGQTYNENKLGKSFWLVVALLLGAAYGPPVLGYCHSGGGVPWR